jgi:hypothetical protein
VLLTTARCIYVCTYICIYVYIYIVYIYMYTHPPTHPPTTPILWVNMKQGNQKREHINRGGVVPHRYWWVNMKQGTPLPRAPPPPPPPPLPPPAALALFVARRSISDTLYCSRSAPCHFVKGGSCWWSPIYVCMYACMYEYVCISYSRSNKAAASWTKRGSS